MVREIQIPPFLKNIEEKTIQMWIDYNDDVLVSHCAKKKPQFGIITQYGIVWKSFDELKNDAEKTCHEFYHLIIVKNDEKIIALAHADKIYNMRIHPFTNTPLE